MAGTVADILDTCELLDNELEVDSGEDDEALAIRAITQAQHYFETFCATFPRVLQTVPPLTTTANTETTTWTSSIIRLDALWYLDANSNPVRKLSRIDEIGGHVPSLPWPLQVTLGTAATGAPYGYYGNMANFYWLPKPDATHTIRVYGLLEQSRFTLRSDAVNYPYRCHLALAQFAVKLLSLGVGDSGGELDKLAGQVFTPLLRQLRKFDRSEPMGRYYTQYHTA